MKRYLPLLVLALVTGRAGTADAGVLDRFKRQPKPGPSEHIPVLLATVKSDPDEVKRAAAAEELHSADGTVYSDVVPTLADVLLHDKSAAVRAEAAKSLGSLRPVTQPAGWALDYAAMNDPSPKVRANARASLTAYQMNGYQRTRTEEPPLAQPSASAASPAPAPTPNNAAPPMPVPERAAPVPTPNTTTARPVPAAEPPAPVPAPAPEKPRFLSRFWPFGRRQSAVPDAPAVAPSSKAPDGPVLSPPK
jgi:hypothetical protein